MESQPLLRIHNTLSGQKEEFAPVQPGRASIYTCGPTVYRNAHIGNLRSYLAADWLRRTLTAFGYTVSHVKNITDVGHMRQEMLERGQDKVLAAALAEGKTPQEIAEFYTKAFHDDERKLNIEPAHEFPKATENVEQMVEFVRSLESKGYAYEVEGNVYFDVNKFEGYGKLSGQLAKGLEEGARVEADPLKRDQRDFTLWKAAEPGRELKWKSPWGDGFPGWHIECSAMVLRYLGDEIDFHTGGVDNIFPHHEDEIAQSEGVLGKRHVRTWLHGQHLLVDGLKMAKSTRNTYLVSDLERRGFDPLAFRYLCATAHYRTRLNFTLRSIKAAQKGLSRLRLALRSGNGRLTKKAQREGEALRTEFWNAAADDLDIPSALAIAWRTARSRWPLEVKRDLLLDFDRLLGLDLLKTDAVPDVSSEIRTILSDRDTLRRKRSYVDADAARSTICDKGYEVRDGSKGSRALPLPAWVSDDSISSSGDVESFLEEPERVDLTVSVVAQQGCAELERCISSVRRWLGDTKSEIIVVDNGFDDDCVSFVDEVAANDTRVTVFHADHFLGSAAARNVSLRQARGRNILVIDTSVEVKGDIFSTLDAALADKTVGIVGRWGVVTNDLRSFDEADASGDVDAVEGYLMAFRREMLREVGLLDEKYRFYRHLDLDFSFAIRNRGYRSVIDVDLPVQRHDHVDWVSTPEEERERLSKRNFYRFLHKWGERKDLIASRQ
ncbi:MAG: cysteine--tRNA ligase [Chloroflexi bacterium]|nr:cysteine--tRNA ligase [Chloroflexota bacterium]